MKDRGEEIKPRIVGKMVLDCNIKQGKVGEPLLVTLHLSDGYTVEIVANSIQAKQEVIRPI